MLIGFFALTNHMRIWSQTTAAEQHEPLVLYYRSPRVCPTLAHNGFSFQVTLHCLLQFHPLYRIPLTHHNVRAYWRILTLKSNLSIHCEAQFLTQSFRHYQDTLLCVCSHFLVLSHVIYLYLIVLVARFPNSDAISSFEMKSLHSYPSMQQVITVVTRLRPLFRSGR